MLRQRILVVLLLLPGGLFVLLRGGWLFGLVGVGLLMAAAWEYTGLWTHQGVPSARGLVLVGVGGVATALYVWGPGPGAWAVLVAGVLLLMARHVLAYARGQDLAATAFVADAAGVAYLAGGGGLLLALRALPYGRFWVLLALVPVWAGDSLAYFAGRWWGRRPLAPRVSPKKTWEGYLAGVLGGTVAAGLWWFGASRLGWLPPAASLATTAGIGLLLALLTPMGDLGESLLKRQAGLKDAGHLLPGHGGVFDRMDSWLWAGALLYWWAWWLTQGTPGVSLVLR